jgi:hypothetical protein
MAASYEEWIPHLKLNLTTSQEKAPFSSSTSSSFAVRKPHSSRQQQQHAQEAAAPDENNPHNTPAPAPRPTHSKAESDALSVRSAEPTAAPRSVLDQDAIDARLLYAATSPWCTSPAATDGMYRLDQTTL